MASDRGRGPTLRMKKTGVVVVAVLVSAYIGIVALFAGTGLGRPHPIRDGRAAADGTTVTMDVEELQPVKGVLTVNLAVVPGAELLDPLTHGLKDDLGVAVTSTVTPVKRTWSKGGVPGVFQVPLTIGGDPRNWPFDSYHTGPISVELYYGAQPPQRVSVSFVDRIPGWKVDVPFTDDTAAPGPYRVSLHRSASTAAFASVIVIVLVTIAGLALFVALQTLRGRRSFQPPMTTWYAALLFSVVPLRNALPDPPPIGFWIDVTVVLWVIVTLVLSMTIYIYCWWRHLPPHADGEADDEADEDAAESSRCDCEEQLIGVDRVGEGPG